MIGKKDEYMNNEKTIMNRDLFAKWISSICEAPLLAIPTFIILNLSLNMNNFLIIETICLLFATIIPISVILLWGKTKGVEKDFPIKETRNFPLLMATAIYLLGTYLLWLFQANPLTIVLMFCYASNTLIVFFINLKWKISVHSMGVAGPTTALMFINPWFFILGLLGPLVMWSRITLKKHTVAQVLAGSIFGYLLTAIQIYYLTKLLDFNANVEFSLILMIIVGLSLYPLILSLASYLKDKKIHRGYIRLISLLTVFGSLLIFLSFFSFIPIIALVFSVSIFLSLAFFGGLDFFKI